MGEHCAERLEAVEVKLPCGPGGRRRRLLNVSFQLWPDAPIKCIDIFHGFVHMLLLRFTQREPDECCSGIDADIIFKPVYSALLCVQFLYSC